MESKARNSYIINHSLRAYLAASILSCIANQLNNTINGIIVSNAVGADAISAITLVSPISFIVMIVGAFITSGAVLLMGPAFGNQRYIQVNKYNMYDFPKGKALPVISNQRMNEYVHELCEEAKIDEPVRQTYYKGNERIDVVLPKHKLVGTHTGRRTFICNALGMGIPPQVVMKWTGHSGYKAMSPYIDVADEMKAEQMKKFNEFL